MLFDGKQFISKFTKWTTAQSDFQGVLLVGSYARGSERADSDIDLVVFCKNIHKRLENLSWIEEFGEIHKLDLENWGPVTSIRVFYTNGAEIEYGMTTRNWASVCPLDPGTKNVVSDGAKVLYDPEGFLDELCSYININN